MNSEELMISREKFVPKLVPKQSKRLVSPIKLNPIPKKKSIVLPGGEESENVFSLDMENCKKDNSFNLSLSSASDDSDSESLDTVASTVQVPFKDYRKMLHKNKSSTVKYAKDTQTILVSEKYIHDYEGLTDKVLVPLKKNSCLYSNPSEMMKGNNSESSKRTRGYSILDILELSCNGSIDFTK